jgi:uncharacterized protein YegL
METPIVRVDSADEGPVDMVALAAGLAALSDRDVLNLIFLRLGSNANRMGEIMTALDNLMQANSAMKQEFVQFLADWQAQLQSANSASDPAIQAVADDMNATVQQMVDSDPAVQAPTPATPTPTDVSASGGTSESGV